MLSLPVTTLVSALCGLFFVFLAVLVIKQRWNTQTSLGEGAGDITLKCRIRAHGNFAEWVPVFLILLLVFEINIFTPYDICFAAICAAIFIGGRMLHAYSLLKDEEYDAAGQLRNNPKFRVAGMMMTMGSIILLSVGLCAGFIIQFMTEGAF